MKRLIKLIQVKTKEGNMLRGCALNRASTLLFPILFLVVALSMSGCRAPLDEDPHVGEPPPIPEEIRGEEGEEPLLKVYDHENGEVEEMSMEDYIAGVVAAEMDSDWDVEALAAQAIIARSFTLERIAEDGGVPERDAHASTNEEEFQAFNTEEINENVEEAVNRTRGEVAVNESEFIRAWFHAYAGPRTALAPEGLDFEEENPPYIISVDSPGKEIIDEDEANWEASFDLDEVLNIVNEANDDEEVNDDDAGEDGEANDNNSLTEISEVEVLEEGPSGRATLIGFKGNGEEASIHAAKLRMELDPTEMRSTFLEEAEISDGELTMSGEGFGHGVGMCQWGARAMAEDGHKAEDIMNYFYENIGIVSLWE